MCLKRVLFVWVTFLGIYSQSLQGNDNCQENLALIHKMWSLGDSYVFENSDDFFADEIIVHSVNTKGEPIHLDRMTLVQWEQKRIDIIPGVWEPLYSFAFDDKVVAYCKCTGMHEGEWLDLPATHKPFSFHGMIMLRFNEGKICETWSAWDRMSLVEQLK